MKQQINIPFYNFVLSIREDHNTTVIQPSEVIILEGIYALYDEVFLFYYLENIKIDKFENFSRKSKRRNTIT